MKKLGFVPIVLGVFAFAGCSNPTPLSPAAAQGTATWARLRSLYVSSVCPPLEPGYACTTFGVVHIPRDVGFRFRYASQGSEIPSGTSPSKNFTWTAGS